MLLFYFVRWREKARYMVVKSTGIARFKASASKAYLHTHTHTDARVMRSRTFAL